MNKKNLHRILIKGGVLSPSELKYILDMCKEIGLSTISFGSRQDILFKAEEGQEEIFKKFPKIRIERGEKRISQNVVSSYSSADIFDGTAWLNGSSYLYILNELNLENKLSVNIVDPKQQFIPLFTGELNFLASTQDSYWYLFLSIYGKLQKYPVIVHTHDLVAVKNAIEELYESCESVEELFQEVNEIVDPSRNISSTDFPIISNDLFPYYEGMHRLTAEKYWLGLYWRNNEYYIDFLQELANLCLECKIGKICLTSWKSIIIKTIRKSDKLKWEKLLGKFGINVRHSLLELNWHVPVADPEAYELKQYIVSIFNQNDISTYGLTIGIYKEHVRNFFTTIVIQKSPTPDLGDDLKMRPTYSILHSKNFSNRYLEYKTFAQDVDKLALPKLLIELSRMFFEQLGKEEDTDLIQVEKKKEVIPQEIFQCSDCFTIYNEVEGDPYQGIPPGTSFHDLPETYTCGTCDAPVESFAPKFIQALNLKN